MMDVVIINDKDEDFLTPFVTLKVHIFLMKYNNWENFTYFLEVFLGGCPS
jgi:hypothetical protein